MHSGYDGNAEGGSNLFADLSAGEAVAPRPESRPGDEDVGTGVTYHIDDVVEGFFLVFGEIGVATEDSGNHGTIAGGGEGLVEGVAGAEGSGLGTRGGVGLVLAADAGEEPGSNSERP